MSVGQYQKKPVVIEAVQLTWPNWNAICDFAPVGQNGCRGVWVHQDGSWSDDPSITGEDVPSVITDDKLGLLIPTLEGDMLAVEGDWIIKGIKGEFYPCKPDIFAESYEAAFTYDSTEENFSMEFQDFVRKPFVVKAVEITKENIQELSSLIGEFVDDETGPHIVADRNKVPTVTRVTPGYWVTKMGKQTRCYSAKVFQEQFALCTVEINYRLDDLENIFEGVKHE